MKNKVLFLDDIVLWWKTDWVSCIVFRELHIDLLLVKGDGKITCRVYIWRRCFFYFFQHWQEVNPFFSFSIIAGSADLSYVVLAQANDFSCQTNRPNHSEFVSTVTITSLRPKLITTTPEIVLQKVNLFWNILVVWPLNC